MTDYKQLCAELLQAWDTAPTPSDFVDTNGYGTIQRIRAALAKPESSGHVTDGSHLITPTPELVQAFLRSNPSTPAEMTYEQFIATRFARWGADQELEGCLEEIRDGAGRLYIDDSKLRVCLADDIWTARRPKPLSLQDQALDDLERIAALLMKNNLPCDTGNIRRALEALPD